MKSLRCWAIVTLAGALVPMLGAERPLARAAAGQIYMVMLASDLEDGDLSDGVSTAWVDVPIHAQVAVGTPGRCAQDAVRRSFIPANTTTDGA